MKDQQKHTCSCSVCGRRRIVIEEELEMLYDSYYEKLKYYEKMNDKVSYLIDLKDDLGGITSTTSNTNGQVHYQTHKQIIKAKGGGTMIRTTTTSSSTGQPQTTEEEFLRNEGKHFIELMEKLAERRVRREEISEQGDDLSKEDFTIRIEEARGYKGGKPPASALKQLSALQRSVQTAAETIQQHHQHHHHHHHHHTCGEEDEDEEDEDEEDEDDELYEEEREYGFNEAKLEKERESGKNQERNERQKLLEQQKRENELKKQQKRLERNKKALEASKATQPKGLCILPDVEPVVAPAAPAVSAATPVPIVAAKPKHSVLSPKSPNFVPSMHRLPANPVSSSLPPTSPVPFAFPIQQPVVNHNVIGHPISSYRSINTSQGDDDDIDSLLHNLQLQNPLTINGNGFHAKDDDDDDISSLQFSSAFMEDNNLDFITSSFEKATYAITTYTIYTIFVIQSILVTSKAIIFWLGIMGSIDIATRTPAIIQFDTAPISTIQLSGFSKLFISPYKADDRDMIEKYQVSIHHGFPGGQSSVTPDAFSNMFLLIATLSGTTSTSSTTTSTTLQTQRKDKCK
eukprot:gene15413-18280_t